MSVPESHPQPQPKPQAKPTTAAMADEPEELKVVQHSQLFYWWPVWAVGFLMAIITFVGGQHMVVVPGSAVLQRTSQDAYEIRANGAPVNVTLEPGQSLPVKDGPFRHMASQPYLGIIFAMILILVIIITNVPLRGMWSVIVIVCLLLLSVIFYYADIWKYIIQFFFFLDIHMNAGGYLFISSALFIIWAVTFFWFDRQIYIIFTPGQMRVREMIGGAETSCDTSGMTTRHLQDDYFRHLILGLGSGDLIVRTTGADSHEYRWNNVLFVRRKLQMIQDMQRERPVVAGG
jgi:hypothetical protein